MQFRLHVRQVRLALFALSNLAGFLAKDFNAARVGKIGIDGGFAGRVVFNFNLLIVDVGKTMEVLPYDGRPAFVMLLPLATMLSL